MKHILVVDDDMGIVTFVETALEREGFTVISTNSGFEALDIVRLSDDIDLIITDLKLINVPGVDIAEEGAKKGIPYLMISGGMGTAAHIQRLLTLGYKVNDDNYLPKPFEVAALINIVKKKLLLNTPQTKQL